MREEALFGGVVFAFFQKYSSFPCCHRSYRKAPSVCLRQPPPSRREAYNTPLYTFTIASHRITSVGDGVGALRKTILKSKRPWGRNVILKSQQNTHRQGASPHQVGVFIYISLWGSIFAFKAKMPQPFGRFLRTLFAKRVLEAAFFPNLSLQKQRKTEKRKL